MKRSLGLLFLMGVVKKPCVGDQLCALDFLSVTFCSDSVQKLFCVPVCLSNRLVSNLNNKCTNSAGSESAVRVMDEATPGVSVYGKSSCGISRHVDSTKSVMFYTSWPTQSHLLKSHNGSHVTFVRRNSPTVVTFRHIYVVMKI